MNDVSDIFTKYVTRIPDVVSYEITSGVFYSKTLISVHRQPKLSVRGKLVTTFSKFFKTLYEKF